jgi:hypothetical protein
VIRGVLPTARIRSAPLEGLDAGIAFTAGLLSALDLLLDVSTQRAFRWAMLSVNSLETPA